MKKTVAIILLIALLVMPCLTACAKQPEPEPTEPVWNSVILKDLLPTPVSGNMDLLSNEQTNLNAWVYDITESDFASYMAACEAAGFTVEGSKTDGIAYKAYNKDGYYLSLAYDVTATQLCINLQEPLKLSEYQWPEMASALPAPASTLGLFERQDENSFLLYVGETSFEEYGKYVKSCIENGFDRKKTQEDTFFEAKNLEGIYVSVRYNGFSIIVIEYNTLGYSSEGGSQNVPDSNNSPDTTPGGSGNSDSGNSGNSGNSGSSGSSGSSGNSGSKVTVTKDQKDFVGMSRMEAETLLRNLGFTNFKYNEIATDDSSKNSKISSVTIKSGSFSKGDTFASNEAVVINYYKVAATETAAQLQVGYGRADITPTQSVPLGGNGNAEVRYSKSVLDRLYATCIAMTEGDETVLLFTQDLLYGYDELTGVRQKISVATGIPKDHIMVSGTHTHSGPSLYTDTKGAVMSAYIKQYCKAMIKAAEDALADRAPATLYGTDVKTNGKTFIRHYIRQDGTYTGANFGTNSSAPIKEHVYDGDREMRLVKAVREGGKQDILMMNFQVHNTVTSAKGGNALYYLSADIAGGIRSTVEGQTDMLFAYFNGACGDQVANSSIKSEQNPYIDIDTYMSYCSDLGHTAINALSKMKKIQGEGVNTAKINYKYDVNKAGLEKLTVAQEIVDKWYSDNATAKRLLKENDISSIHEANAIVSRKGWPNSATMELNVISAGGMAFVIAPYEMFAINGMNIKEDSPFDMTMVLTCANYVQRYFPTEAAYDYHAYEALTSYFAKGCAEAAQKQFIKLLKKLV